MHLQGPLSASLTAGAIAGIVVGVFAAVCCCCLCFIATVYYCSQSNKSHNTTSAPRTSNVHSATSRSYPTVSSHASAPPAAVVMTAIQTEAYVYNPQQEPPPSFYPQAQTHAGEAPPDYSAAYYYPKVETF